VERNVCAFVISKKDNNWWVSKHFRQDVESTVTCLAWHPNNILIAAGGTDNIVRVVSGFVTGIDNRKDVAGGTPFGSKLPFGSLCASWKTNGWVKSVRWSPSGNRLAWVCHDSTTHFLECATTEHKLQSVLSPYLPFQDLEWVDDNRVIAVGHDANPTLFNFVAAGGWKLEKQLDGKKGSGGKAQGEGAKKFFQDKATHGEGDTADRMLETQHQNCISVIRRLDATHFSTTGLDGNLGVWSYSSLGL